jgi:hypothetical protein
MSEELASRRAFEAHLVGAWPAFQARRIDRLAPLERYGRIPERAAEAILEDLLTLTLGWSVANLNWQLEYADLVISDRGIKRAVVEVKRPGKLIWGRAAIEAALAQAPRYARTQGVQTVAVSDGDMLYSADITTAGLRHRLLVDLSAQDPHHDLWWLSNDGIYRVPPVSPAIAWPSNQVVLTDPETILDPRHHLPAACFAFVGDTGRPVTWHLPYRSLDGTPDPHHLPGAINAILGNYRGTHERTIPEAAIPGVLAKLEAAAREAGLMPDQNPLTAPCYHALAQGTEQQRHQQLGLAGR